MLSMTVKQSSLELRMRIIRDQLCQAIQVNSQSSHCKIQVKSLKTEADTGHKKNK